MLQAFFWALMERYTVGNQQLRSSASHWMVGSLNHTAVREEKRLLTRTARTDALLLIGSSLADLYCTYCTCHILYLHVNETNFAFGVHQQNSIPFFPHCGRWY